MKIGKFSGVGFGSTGMLLLWVSCTAVPTRGYDQGALPDCGDGACGSTGASATWRVDFDRAFGLEGELPTFLVAAGPERYLALTNQACYALTLEGRVSQRSAWPDSSTGAQPSITAARWDGAGLGLALRWGKDDQRAAGFYLALTGGMGQFSAAELIALGPAAGAALSDWDGQAHRVVWLEPMDGSMTLQQQRVTRRELGRPRRLLERLLLGTQAGAWIATLAGQSALCTLEPDGQVLLRRFSDDEALPAVSLGISGRRAHAPCALASSGRSFLITFLQTGVSPSNIDAGPRDLGLGALSYDEPVAQVVDPAGAALLTPVRLTQYPGTVTVESVLWDGQRYLVLLNAAGYRGGRLLLAALEESGRLLWRDQVIPLVYEPGLLLAAQMIATPSHLALIYAIKQPWDEGILHLAQLLAAGSESAGWL
jgi:hypothetical protein